MGTLRILRKKLLAWLRMCVCEVVSNGLGRFGVCLDLRSLCFSAVASGKWKMSVMWCWLNG